MSNEPVKPPGDEDDDDKEDMDFDGEVDFFDSKIWCFLSWWRGWYIEGSWNNIILNVKRKKV